LKNPKDVNSLFSIKKVDTKKNDFKKMKLNLKNNFEKKMKEIEEDKPAQESSLRLGFPWRHFP